jgi:hypothetical protein
MSNIKLVCATCGNNFDYYKSEYNRQTKRGRDQFYCSLSCSSKRPSNLTHLKRVSKKFVGGENKLVTEDDFIRSSMNEFIRRVRGRKKAKEKFGDHNIDSNYLVKVWNNQNGLCAYTKVPLILPSYKNYKSTSYNYKASIDRIDSTKGYEIGNIQFISYTMNNLKSNMSSGEVQEFISLLHKLNLY